MLQRAVGLDSKICGRRRCPGARTQKARLRGLGEIGGIEIIAVKRRDRIGMKYKALLSGDVADDRLDGGTRGRGVCGRWRSGIAQHDDETAERLPRTDRDRHVAPKARLRTEMGLNLVFHPHPTPTPTPYRPTAHP